MIHFSHSAPGSISDMSQSPLAATMPAALLRSSSFQLERLRRHVREEVDAALSVQETTLREYWLLSCLIDRDATSQTELSEMLAIDTSDMVRLIDSLENRTWVKRKRDPQDRRRQIVAATKKGTRARAELAELIADAEDRALDESTPKQLKHLRKLAGAIISHEEN